MVKTELFSRNSLVAAPVAPLFSRVLVFKPTPCKQDDRTFQISGFHLCMCLSNTKIATLFERVWEHLWTSKKDTEVLTIF